MQKVRETGDAAFYARAQTAFGQGLKRDPRDAGSLTGMGALALARHDFAGGLRYGIRAHAAAPEVVRPYGVIVDAQVELGRYRDAARTLQRMVDLKPNLSSYARVSYFRELHGDLSGALEAMRLAASAGGDTAGERWPTCRRCSATCNSTAASLGQAEAAYRLGLARYPRYVPAQAGLARVDAARGRLGAAIRRYRAIVARLPLPEHVIALGEAEQAAGRGAAAERDLALVAVEQRLLQRSGVNTDTELALFEANHGNPRRAVALARRAWAARRACAPPTRSDGRWRAPAARHRRCHGRGVRSRSGPSIRRSSTTRHGREGGRPRRPCAPLADAVARAQSTLVAALRPAREAGAGGAPMRRLLVLAVAARRRRRGAAPAAFAHPLGNFSINHLTQVRVSRDRVDARYVLDQAEIPTFQERGLSPAEVLRRKRAEILRGLRLEVDGRAIAFSARPGATISFPPGQGGLKLTRVELPLSAAVDDPRHVVVSGRHVPGPGRVEGDPGAAREAALRCARASSRRTRPTGCGAIPRTRSRARSTSARRPSRSPPGRGR